MEISFNQTSVRDFQHNLSKYIDLAQVRPVSVTKYGKRVVLLVNPQKYQVVEKPKIKSSSTQLMQSAFVGMHKNKKEWAGKTNLQIVDQMRKAAWYGK